MRGFAALVRHEIHERRALLAAAAVASLLPVLAPLLPATGSNPSFDTREAVMWVMVFGLVPLFALLLGVSFIGRDLAEGRIGFYYAQPLSGPTIWFGKLTAVLLLVWGSQLLIMLPTVVLAPDPLHALILPDFLDPFTPRWLAPFLLVVVAAAIVLVAHAIGIVWRARSAWLVVDTIALLVVVAFGWLAVAPFYIIVAPDIALGAMWWIAAWVMVGLMAAGAVQAAVGRVDLGRGHRALSVALWTILIVSTTALLGWTAWVRSARLDDLDAVSAVSTGPGDWIAVSGESSGRFDYHPRFLVNVADGRSLAIGPAANWHGTDVTFSGDGSTAAWLEAEGQLSWALMTADLTAGAPQPASTGVTLDADWEDFAIAPDGSRLAVLEGRTLAVYHGQPSDQLTAVRIADDIDPIAILFDDPASVRILASSREDGLLGDARWWLLWLDVKGRRLSGKVEIETPWGWRQRLRDGRADHALALVPDGDCRHVAIRDPETGEVLRDLGVSKLWSVRLTGDGNILVIRNRDGHDQHLELIGPTGETVTSIDLPDAMEVFDAGLVTPERLLLGLIDWTDEGADRRTRYRTILVDLTAGTCSEVASRYIPVLGRWGARTSTGSWAVGAVASRLLRGEDDALQLWDPDTGELRQLIPVPD